MGIENSGSIQCSLALQDEVNGKRLSLVKTRGWIKNKCLEIEIASTRVWIDKWVKSTSREQEAFFT